MWSVISKFFSKTNTHITHNQLIADDFNMDRGEDRRRTAADLEPQDTYDTRQAKQRASIKWLLSKAYNNKVPENLREPFYRDQEDQEHLKPQIVHTLANAELYCLGLANIYSDPNYHNLNHWGIIQALARKGVFVSEPSDAQLTETVLIQTTPIKLSAHMAVIEAMMVLYAKEVVTPDRVVAAIQRFSHSLAPSPEESLPADHEDGLLLWVSRACAALRQRVEQELEQGDGKGGEGDRLHAPEFPAVRELKDLCDGVCLAALVSFYCPEELPWTDVVVSYLPTISDSVQNLLLVYNFCNRCLPSSVFHMMPEDVTYMQGSMKHNLIVFLADLFNVLEIHPVKCVRFPGTERATHLKEVYPRNSQGVAHKRSFPQSISAIPDLRSNLGAHSSSFTVSKSSSTIQTSLPMKKSHSLQQADIHGKGLSDVHDKGFCQDERHSSSDEAFVVHRGRAVPTLASVAQAEEPLLPARLRPAKEKQNQDSKAEERGEPVAAGRPSNWEDSRRSSYAGRRSRRNSMSDDSQLTLENFGGSQENLHLLGRNPDKEPAVHVGRRAPADGGSAGNVSSTVLSTSTANLANLANPAVRSTFQDARSTGVELIFSHHNTTAQEKQDEEKPTVSLRQMLHSKEDTIDTRESRDMADGDLGSRVATSFAELSRAKGGIHIVYMQHDREQDSGGGGTGTVPPMSSILNKKTNNTTNGGGEKKTTTFAALPNNTTTWQQQSTSNQIQQSESQSALEDPNSSHVMASQLHNIRMKLEEKRRRIESEKRRMEVVMSKQRQKVGKAAFLQAVTKGKSTFIKTPDSDSGKDSNGDLVENVAKPQRPFSLQEISEDVSSVEHKWLDSTVPFIEERRTPDIENMDLEQYQQSLAQMNSSLHEIQADIQRLATQQHQIQDHSQSLAFQQPQFYLHEQQAHRRTWAQQTTLPQDGRSMWGDTQSGRQVGPSPLDGCMTWDESARPPQNGRTMWDDSHAPPPQHVQNGRIMWNDARTALSPPPQLLQDGRTMWRDSQVALSPMQDARAMWGDTQAIRQVALSPQPQPQPLSQPQPQPQPQSQPQPLQNGRAMWSDSQSMRQSAVSPHQDSHTMWGDMQVVRQVALSPPPQPQPQPSQNGRPVWGDSQAVRHQKQQPTSYNCQPPAGFVLHDSKLSYPHQYHNGEHHSAHHSLGTYSASPGASPQHRSSVHRISQLLGDSSSDSSPDKGRASGIMHAPIPTPPVDDMEPQSISFIGMPGSTAEDGLAQSIKGLQITSGSRTYRIPSPTRPAIARNSFQQQEPADADGLPGSPLLTEEDPTVEGVEKGFYISFDIDTQPKRPKPPLRVKKSSPKKERPVSQYDSIYTEKEDLRPVQPRVEPVPSRERERERELEPCEPDEGAGTGVGLVIGTELLNPDPGALDEMERKKERIMLLSLQRRQQQEELKQHKEQEAQRRRDVEKFKQEERERKKEEERLRRAAILEQYKLKKAIEEAEREGKLLPDKSDLANVKPVPKMRNKTSAGSRPRPKTIHVDSGGVDLQEGILSPSRSKKGSTSNLTDTVYNPHMRRDFYRGSQDSLAERMEERRGMGASLFRDSPDDGRGASPCRSVNQLGRRGSYKTSRDVSEPGRVRGRQKYPTYQGNFRGRKSNSLMNLCGSSTDQDSMVYRYTDTDSGLGRATPPRRAPSPGMSSMRHLPSPSGPGSLPPGLMTKRRMFDDGSSDISSIPSSMLEYTGPRLYKQPATKSNRGIMLNAVEYCVFPGVVNKEAKRRVLEEIARSESKHFLILFRDAGCQFRALYSYCPEREEVAKLYGTGPKQVNDRMFDKFFKYNSGGKCFSIVHTKHLTVTIDAFTIHNSLWQGKKVALPNKKDMALVI